MTTTVKHFHSAMTGAPVLSGTAGSLIAILDACLVNGFALKTADSVVVSGGVATATFSTGHSFEPDVIALASGATPSGLNGEKRVLTVATNTITYDASGIADGTATGTITFKIAPAGWEKTFSGTNLAVYRGQDPAGTRMFLRVDDTDGRNARVVGYESMTDVNVGFGAFPSSTQVTGGGYWPKSNAADSTPRVWTLMADPNTVWLHLHTSASSPGAGGGIVGFGDFASYKSGDAYRAGLWCYSSDYSFESYLPGRGAELTDPNGVEGVFVARSFTGVGGCVDALKASEGYFNSRTVSGNAASAATPKYPNGPNNGLILTRQLIVESGQALRGVARGMLLCPQNCHAAFGWRNKVPGQGSYANRILVAIKAGAPAVQDSRSVVFFDITGPWS